MKRSRLILLTLLISIFFLVGCQFREKKEALPALSLLEEGLKERKFSGELGRFGWLRSFFIQEVQHDSEVNQSLLTTCLETTDYYLLLKYDFRRSDFEWKEYGVVKLESLDKTDVEQPYRFWLRRFFFYASH